MLLLHLFQEQFHHQDEIPSIIVPRLVPISIYSLDRQEKNILLVYRLLVIKLFLKVQQ